jgi:putative hydrolase of HD superfamily
MAEPLESLPKTFAARCGRNPPDFDYAFNLGYGRRCTDTAPLFRTIRAIVDADTQRRIDARDARAQAARTGR